MEVTAAAASHAAGPSVVCHRHSHSPVITCAHVFKALIRKHLHEVDLDHHEHSHAHDHFMIGQQLYRLCGSVLLHPQDHTHLPLPEHLEAAWLLHKDASGHAIRAPQFFF